MFWGIVIGVIATLIIGYALLQVFFYKMWGSR